MNSNSGFPLADCLRDHTYANMGRAKSGKATSSGAARTAYGQNLHRVKEGRITKKGRGKAHLLDEISTLKSQLLLTQVQLNDVKQQMQRMQQGNGNGMEGVSGTSLRQGFNPQPSGIKGNYAEFGAQPQVVPSQEILRNPPGAFRSSHGGVLRSDDDNYDAMIVQHLVKAPPKGPSAQRGGRAEECRPSTSRSMVAGQLVKVCSLQLCGRHPYYVLRMRVGGPHQVGRAPHPLPNRVPILLHGVNEPMTYLDQVCMALASGVFMCPLCKTTFTWDDPEEAEAPHWHDVSLGGAGPAYNMLPTAELRQSMYL